MEKSKENSISDRVIIEKAWEDEAFKQELLANPKAAIEKLAGGPINSLKDKEFVAMSCYVYQAFRIFCNSVRVTQGFAC